MNYGYFDDEKREYVITNPRTPVKWINYIGTLAFGGFVDHTGGRADLRQATRRSTASPSTSPRCPASDFKGETLYLRIRMGERLPRLFAVLRADPRSVRPLRVPRGLGYTRIVSEFYGMRSRGHDLRPARAGDCEIRDIQITNICRPADRGGCHPGGGIHPSGCAQAAHQRRLGAADDGTAGASARPTAGRCCCSIRSCTRDTRVNYFTSNLPASSFETDRGASWVTNEYGSWAQPAGSLHEPELSNYETQRGDNIAALLVATGRALQPGETRRLLTLVGSGRQPEGSRAGHPQDVRFPRSGCRLRQSIGAVLRAATCLRCRCRPPTQILTA